MLKLALILALTTSLSFAPAIPQRTELPFNHPSVVKLESGSGICTGWVVAPGKVVTAAHCAHDGEVTNFVATFADGHEADFTLKKVGTTLTSQDVALLVGDTADAPTLLIAERPTQFPSTCFIVGYGGGESEHISPCVAESFDSDGMGDILVMSAQAIGGDSGGPVLGAGGEVIGVVFAGRKNPRGNLDEAIAVASWTLRAFLAE